MILLGGNLRNPGRVIAPDFDLARKDIRDVRVTVDYRKVVSEVLRDHIGISQNRLENVAFRNNSSKFTMNGLYNVV